MTPILALAFLNTTEREESLMAWHAAGGKDLNFRNLFSSPDGLAIKIDLMILTKLVSYSEDFLPNLPNCFAPNSTAKAWNKGIMKLALRFH